jgi:hypothetical protein
LITLLQDTPNGREMRVEKWKEKNWQRVWTNLWVTPVEEVTKDAWYSVIHDIIPIKERFHAIRLAQTDQCPECNVPDTLSHRVAVCGTDSDEWEWTRKRLTVTLRIDQRWIPEEWLYRPQYWLWPPQSHKAVLWLLARLVEYRTERGKILTTHDYHDFLQRSKRKLYQQYNRLSLVGIYLSVLDT